tara:strand:- start:787 stop:1044 length:258 start_codon:yes stop_codon:yes gene_type:complete
MKQTAVEWLLEELNDNGFSHLDLATDIIEQAKEMEKEQIINSHVTGIIEPLIMKNYKGLSVDEIKVEITKQAEEYYNETFKNEIK